MKNNTLRERIKEIMDDYMDHEEGSGSANWDGKYTKRIIKVVESKLSEARKESQIDVLQRQRGVMGKYNCELGRKCIFVKKYFELAEKELKSLK